MYLLGYDIGSSFIKATLMNAESGEIVETATSPETELEIIANPQDAFIGLKTKDIIEPRYEMLQAYKEAYVKWINILELRF